MPWFGDNHLRACTTCKVGFVVPSDDADFWKPSVVRGEQRFEVKLGCPKCRLTAKEQRRVRLLRGGSPASSSTSDVVRRSPPPTPSIAPSASEAGTPSPSPYKIGLQGLPLQKQTTVAVFLDTMPQTFDPMLSPRGSRVGGSRATGSVGGDAHPGPVSYAQSFTSSEVRTKGIFQVNFEAFYTSGTWAFTTATKFLSLFLMVVVGLATVVWITVELCHWMSILWYFASFLSKGALDVFAGHANLTKSCPLCDSCCGHCPARV
ncbi:hypothetical protein T484DRAFT_1981093 [Baffinella frigidus]|nr:hypothetical protein T484DRAFT_1981093 [Cryptophyta sp. CCMP2293]